MIFHDGRKYIKEYFFLCYKYNRMAKRKGVFTCNLYFFLETLKVAYTEVITVRNNDFLLTLADAM